MEKIDGRIILIVLGFIFIMFGKYIMIRYKNLIKKGIKTRSRVIENQLGVKSKRMIVIEYRVNEELFRKRVVLNRYLFNLDKVVEINIFYDRRKPKKICFENDIRHSINSKWLFFFGGLGLILRVLSFFQYK